MIACRIRRILSIGYRLRASFLLVPHSVRVKPANRTYPHHSSHILYPSPSISASLLRQTLLSGGRKQRPLEP
jgi:hypothetical protein